MEVPVQFSQSVIAIELDLPFSTLREDDEMLRNHVTPAAAAGRDGAVARRLRRASLLGSAGLSLCALALPTPGPAATTRSKAVVGEADIVGGFTTAYPCCQPRVTNIMRAARTLDRLVIPPDESFSMNAALGQRTTAKGYVAAPTIAGDRLVDSVGGGISQVATTLYNAAFFSGLELTAHTPHSFYISRYPPGREATISWGGPELIFRNQWRAPLSIRVSTTQTSITVRLVSRGLGRHVRSWTGRPYALERPTTYRIVNPALPPGSMRVVQEAGGSGFTIQYGRSVYQRKRLLSQENFRVRYAPENRIIEVGPR